MGFEIGDRVIYTGTHGFSSGSECLYAGCTGTVVGTDPVICVEWDHEHEFFHTAGGLARPGHGWFCEEREIGCIKTGLSVGTELDEYAVLCENWR